MQAAAQTFHRIVEDRRSVRQFSPDAEFDHDAVTRSLKSAILAPNSSNLQLWEFHRVRSDEMRAGLAECCFGQPAASTARELIVVLTRRDLWEQRNQWLIGELKKGFPDPESKAAKGTLNYYEELIPKLYSTFPFSDPIKRFSMWNRGRSKMAPREVTYTDTRIVVHKSAALAAENFMLGMTAEGFDSCPMEGFDSVRVKELLNLPEGAELNMIIGTGPGLPEGIYGPRIRLPFESVVVEH